MKAPLRLSRTGHVFCDANAKCVSCRNCLVTKHIGYSPEAIHIGVVLWKAHGPLGVMSVQ
jgi:hypothetical protein